MLTRATYTHPHPRAGATTDAHLVISLHGEQTTGQQRAPISVVPVVDVSGSMGTGRKLQLVTTALAYLSEHLAETDRLALVAFDSHATCRVPLVLAQAEAVSAFTTALASLRPGSMTALADGIRLGLAQAAAAPADTLARIVVLTDGQANVGVHDLDSLTDLVRSRPDHVSISFLGVGTDCDHDLLGHLAEHGGGNYGFIESGTDAPAALGNEIGGLLDAEAHNLTVEITVRDRYCTLQADTPLGMAGDRDGHTLTTTVAQVLRGTTRHVIVPVTLTGAGRNHARPVTCATVLVRGSIGEDEIEVELRPKVKFGPDAGEVDTDLVEKVELAQVAQAITDARAHAHRGDYASAREVFAGARLTTATALTLRNNLAGSYDNAQAYASSRSTLSSARAATSGSLSNASASFNSLAQATIGSVYSDGQRRMAAETTLNSRVHSDPDPTPTLNLPGEAGWWNSSTTASTATSSVSGSNSADAAVSTATGDDAEEGEES